MSRANIAKDRALLGLPGGFRHVIFIVAFAIPEQDVNNLMAIFGAEWMHWARIQQKK